MQHTFRKRMVRLFVSLLFLCILLAFCYAQNNWIQVTDYTISSDDLPESFNGCTIVHVSDLHNKMFGKEQKKLITELEKLSPDMIMITGDLVDSNKPDVEKSMIFIRRAVKIAPVYFVTGNHDNWLSKENTKALFQGLEECGVVVLRDDNRVIQAEKGGNKGVIYLLGIDDDSLLPSSKLNKTLAEMTADIQEDDFTILLSHEPQLLETYALYPFDLVLTGHAHGGQFRIPFVGGFVAPDQGFLPKYTAGYFKEKNTQMLLSRGLGNSVIPIRIFNRPELIKITLTYKIKNS